MIASLCKVRSSQCLRSAEISFLLRDHVKNSIRPLIKPLNSSSYDHRNHRLGQRKTLNLCLTQIREMQSGGNHYLDQEFDDEMSEDEEYDVNIQSDLIDDSVLSQEFIRNW